jgi:hypothetical protein
MARLRRVGCGQLDPHSGPVHLGIDHRVVPGIGDLIGGVLSSTSSSKPRGAEARSPAWAERRRPGVPILGDLFDIGLGVNIRNLALL